MIATKCDNCGKEIDTAKEKYYLINEIKPYVYKGMNFRPSPPIRREDNHLCKTCCPIRSED